MTVLGRTGLVEGVDYRGQPIIANIRPAPDSPWFLITRKNTAEVYRQARGQLWIIVKFVTDLLFGSAAALALVWSQQALALYKEREKADKALSEIKTLQGFCRHALRARRFATTWARVLSWKHISATMVKPN